MVLKISINRSERFSAALRFRENEVAGRYYLLNKNANNLILSVKT